MSNYHMTPGPRGLSYPLGATEWGWDQYQNLAVAKAMSTAGTWILVQVGRDGAFTRAAAYPSRQALLAAWDALTVLSGDVGFAIAYDKAADGVVEQKVNPAIESLVQRKIDWKRLTPWVVGGAAVLAAAIFFSRKKRGAAAPRRASRRARATWRRRTVTVWR